MRIIHKDSDRIVSQQHIIMSRSEEPYMRQLIGQIKGGVASSVLEAGFGLGITANLIQDIIRPRRHVIVESEPSIHADSEAFAEEHVGVEPQLGDFFTFPCEEFFDMVFYDVYDYELTAITIPQSYNTVHELTANEVSRVNKFLKIGGFLCHPFFGDMQMPEIRGFKLHYSGAYQGPPFLLWDGTKCCEGQLGFYEKLDSPP